MKRRSLLKTDTVFWKKNGGLQNYFWFRTTYGTIFGSGQYWRNHERFWTKLRNYERFGLTNLNHQWFCRQIQNFIQLSKRQNETLWVLSVDPKLSKLPLLIILNPMGIGQRHRTEDGSVWKCETTNGYPFFK
jgi:hypothetical protein